MLLFGWLMFYLKKCEKVNRLRQKHFFLFSVSNICSACKVRLCHDSKTFIWKAFYWVSARKVCLKLYLLSLFRIRHPLNYLICYFSKVLLLLQSSYSFYNSNENIHAYKIVYKGSRKYMCIDADAMNKIMFQYFLHKESNHIFLGYSFRT